MAARGQRVQRTAVAAARRQPSASCRWRWARRAAQFVVLLAVVPLRLEAKPGQLFDDSEYEALSSQPSQEAAQELMETTTIAWGLIKEAEISRLLEKGWHDVISAITAASLMDGFPEKDNIHKYTQKAVQKQKARLDRLIMEQDKNFEKVVEMTPSMQWAQNSTHAFLSVKFAIRWDAPGAIKVRNESIQFDKNGFDFSAMGEHSHITKKYLLKNVTLFRDVWQASCTFVQASVGKATITLPKVKQGRWPRLLRDPEDQLNRKLGTWTDLQQKYKEELAHYPMLTDTEKVGWLTKTKETMVDGEAEALQKGQAVYDETGDDAKARKAYFDALKEVEKKGGVKLVQKKKIDHDDEDDEYDPLKDPFSPEFKAKKAAERAEKAKEDKKERERVEKAKAKSEKKKHKAKYNHDEDEPGLDREQEILTKCDDGNYKGSSVIELCTEVWHDIVESPQVERRRWLVQLYSSKGDGNQEVTDALIPTWKGIAETFQQQVDGGRVGSVDCAYHKKLCQKIGASMKTLPEIWRCLGGPKCEIWKPQGRSPDDSVDLIIRFGRGGLTKSDGHTLPGRATPKGREL
eukprot:gnl/TRDRNA2_/TRDRNA2_35115_c0_seq1.p1 gnl/TRDRNA2_/TRDRNA2_35115_c0~~gnl/TRDRNA2_/TRDRNA2_35115_c0_seq1.p1  ORF type:complete len:584 (-),score=130.33 gnl/TRDRNA2_/TRDRNA2_35115_c0_seq1:279-2003(-)